MNVIVKTGAHLISNKNLIKLKNQMFFFLKTSIFREKKKNVGKKCRIP